MNIKEVYGEYRIPLNLQEHMLRVASIGALIVDHWVAEGEVDRKIVVGTLLLHDMGNVIKFDLNGTFFRQDMEEIERLRHLQREFIDVYGTDEDVATEAIARELKVDPKILELLSVSQKPTLEEILNTHDWNKKVKSYSDQRVGPHGVLTLNARFDDLIRRYAGRNHKLSNREKLEETRQAALKVEEQLQQRVTIDLQSIGDSSIQEYMTSLTGYVL